MTKPAAATMAREYPSVRDAVLFIAFSPRLARKDAPVIRVDGVYRHQRGERGAPGNADTSRHSTGASPNDRQGSPRPALVPQRGIGTNPGVMRVSVAPLPS